ncbi:hypothetical protein HK405_013840 [Cladochytrium tenue]|nr:hypothetical protein HK405_013840 [Cladochytrium tenue]
MRFSFGCSTHIGRRPTQQDAFVVIESLFGGSPAASLYGVFDGHGTEGGKASSFVQRELPVALRSRRDDFLADPVGAMKAVFREVNTRLAEDDSIDTYMSGTTAVVLVCLEDAGRVVVANVGDSRVLLARKEDDDWVAVQLTKIVVTRALGDAVAGRLGVLSEPEVVDIRVNPKQDRAFILGTDGLWDGLSPEQAVAVAAKYRDPTKASNALTKRALEGLDAKQIDDNVTNVVVYVNTQ